MQVTHASAGKAFNAGQRGKEASHPCFVHVMSITGFSPRAKEDADRAGKVPCISWRAGLFTQAAHGKHRGCHMPTHGQVPCRSHSGWESHARSHGLGRTHRPGLRLTRRPLPAAAVEEEPQRVLCDAACTERIDANELVTLPSGLQYRDVVVGKGPSPPIGYQVVVHYVAMSPKYRVFDNSLERGAPYDLRVGAGSVVAGLDEGLQTMKPGGIRRLYIPGPLSFPKGLKAAAGRPSIPPSSPVIFDVQLLYIPGLEDEE